MGFKRVEPSKVMRGIKFYIVEDLAKILDITPHAVRKYLRTGRIASVKVGQRFWVSEKNLNSFLLCKGIRDLPDDDMIKMINEAVQVRFNEWEKQIMPIIDEKMVELFELHKKAYVNIKKMDKNNEKLEKVLPKEAMKHIRYRGEKIKKEFAEIK